MKRMRHKGPLEVRAVRPKMQRSCLHELLPIITSSSSVSPLSAVDLSVLACSSKGFYTLPWPRTSIIWNSICVLRQRYLGSTFGATTIRSLERLGERLRSPGVVMAAVACADGFRRWAEEQRCRAAWGIAVALPSLKHDELKNEDGEYILRFLIAGLVEPPEWALLSTASAFLGLALFRMNSLSQMREDTDLVLNDLGVMKFLMQLVQNSSAQVQLLAVQATHLFGCWDEAGKAVPALVSIAQSGCHDNKLAALEAISRIAGHNAIFASRLGRAVPEGLQGAIPVLVRLLGHESEEMKDYAVEALSSVMSVTTAFKREAFELGCIPKLLDYLRREGRLGWCFMLRHAFKIL